MFDWIARKSYSNKVISSSLNLDGYEPMPVAHQLRGVILRRIGQGQPVLPEIDGREEMKADVIRALLSGSYPYLVSEEGTGKTRLARSLTRLLPPIPVIAGCPYHDDPKWPAELLCPRCKASKNPAKEFGIELVGGQRRFSRIQGNEYTNEAKVLGLKDIQAIAQGRSPSDPRVFTGAGVFRANRGILMIDELPAIRTKVQVLFHPILEEKKAILEEYNWQHPLDLILIATGNPQGFSHVNEIPRPLLDRVELIYMDLPEEDVEKEIMLKERFRVNQGHEAEPEASPPLPSPSEIARGVAAPWWIMDVVNKAVRYSRICPHVEKKASIRATNKAIDHTYASVEMEGKRVAGLRHAYHGLRLALRGRVGLRVDLIDFDNAKKTFKLTDDLAADFMWNAVEDMRGEGLLDNCERDKLGPELGSLLAEGRSLDGKVPAPLLSQYEELSRTIRAMNRMAKGRVRSDLLSEVEAGLYHNRQAAAELNYSAVEMLANICIHERFLDQSQIGSIFIPQKFKP